MQVWDGILFVVYLGCTPVLYQVQYMFPKLLHLSQVKLSYTKSYPHKYTHKYTHKDAHKYEAYRYATSAMLIHTYKYSQLTPTKNAHEYTYS